MLTSQTIVSIDLRCLIMVSIIMMVVVFMALLVIMAVMVIIMVVMMSVTLKKVMVHAAVADNGDGQTSLSSRSALLSR